MSRRRKPRAPDRFTWTGPNFLRLRNGDELEVAEERPSIEGRSVKLRNRATGSLVAIATTGTPDDEWFTLPHPWLEPPLVETKVTADRNRLRLTIRASPALPDDGSGEPGTETYFVDGNDVGEIKDGKARRLRGPEAERIRRWFLKR